MTRNFFRRNRRSVDRVPGDRIPMPHRYTELEVTRQQPYPAAPGATLADAQIRLRQYVEALPFVDPGTAAAADREILAWLAGWYSQLNAARAEHLISIRTQIGQAATDLAGARRRYQHTENALARARADHAQFHLLLTGRAVPAPDHTTTTHPHHDTSGNPINPGNPGNAASATNTPTTTTDTGAVGTGNPGWGGIPEQRR